MKPIKRYILRYWYAYLAAILFLVISVSLDMLSPQMTRSIIEDFCPHPPGPVPPYPELIRKLL